MAYCTVLYCSEREPQSGLENHPWLLLSLTLPVVLVRWTDRLWTPVAGYDEQLGFKAQSHSLNQTPDPLSDR